MKVMEVVAGVITDDHNLIFCVQRGENSRSYISKKWEFPGGKVEEGETDKSALERELNEEPGLSVSEITYFSENKHEYETFSIHLIAFKCNAHDNPKILVDHDKFEWLSSKEIKKLNFAEADMSFVEIL